MDKATIRVLIVDDFEPWRQFAGSVLQRQPDVQIVGEVTDGLEAIQKAQALRPDFILLDIGLPTLNGIEAARRIHELVPEAKILFASQNNDAETVKMALSNGARGYLLKSDGAKLPSAIQAVIRGERFLSAGLRDPKSD